MIPKITTTTGPLTINTLTSSKPKNVLDCKRPDYPVMGEMYYDPNENKLYLFTVNGWETIEKKITSIYMPSKEETLEEAIKIIKEEISFKSERDLINLSLKIIPSLRD
jgi:hypothetical protein